MKRGAKTERKAQAARSAPRTGNDRPLPAKRPGTSVARAARTNRPAAALANSVAESQQIAAATVVWVKRSRYNPLRQLTPEYLSRVIDYWNNGYLRDFSLMADAIKRRDPVINVSLRKREKGVARHGFEVLLREGLEGAQKARAEQHQEILNYFFNNLTVTHVLEQDVNGGFRLLVEQMMSAIGERYAVHEIVWKPTVDPITNQPRLTAQLIFVPVWFFEATTGKLRFIRQYIGSVMGEEMVDDQWLVTVGDGLMEPLSVAYLFKHAALEAWTAFGERFGTPGIQGKTAAAKDSPAWNDFADAVARFGQEWATITSQDATIELIEAKGSAGTLPFPELIEKMDKAIATICRGADLSTMSSGRGMMGRGASLQGDETELLEEDDAMLISESLKKISRLVIKQQLGDDEPLAYLQIMIPEKKNSADIIAKLSFLVGSGVEVGADYARKELGVPPPAPGEETLKSNQVAPELVQDDKPEGAAALSNAAHPPVDAGEAVFRRNSIRTLSTAEAEAMQPVLDRIADLKDLSDEQYAAGLQQFRQDLPRLFAEARLHVPDIAHVWDQVLGTALVDGLADLPSKKSK